MLIKHINRRSFLKTNAVITAGSLLFPSFLKASGMPQSVGKRLVVIQLSGGNDGLNTIIPYRNDTLIRVRPFLAGIQNELVKATDDLAFNPGMRDFKTLYDSGDCCIINQVGYPNPNRSHFRSMDIWQSASNANEYLDTGWLGRYLDNECPPEHQITSIEIGNMLSLAMKGENLKGLPVTDFSKFYESAKRIEVSQNPAVDNPTASFLYKTINDCKHSAEYLHEKIQTHKTTFMFPGNQLGKKLKQVAISILSGVESPIFYTSLTGFDTHNNQLPKQQRLLEYYSESVLTLANELKAAGEWDNTLILTFSEFGRRVTQNASRGTDHGKANNIFLHGGGLKKLGLYNPISTLQSLDEGDIPFEIDFRQVYATILEKWLGANSKPILGKNYPMLDFI